MATLWEAEEHFREHWRQYAESTTETRPNPVLFQLEKSTERSMDPETVMYQVTTRSTSSELAEDGVNQPQSFEISYTGQKF